MRLTFRLSNKISDEQKKNEQKTLQTIATDTQFDSLDLQQLKIHFRDGRKDGPTDQPGE